VLAGAASLGGAAPRFHQALGAGLGWDVVVLWGADGRAGVLRCVARWRARGGRGAELEAACRGAALPPGAGLPGAVWAAGRPLESADPAADADDPRSAAAGGLGRAFAFPVRSDKGVLGVIECFGRGDGSPREQLDILAGAVGSQVGQFLEHRLADEALRRSEALLRAVSEGTTDAVFVKDLRGRYLMINPAGARLLGRSVEEVIGKDDRELFDPDGARRIMEGDRRVIAVGQTLTYEEAATAAGVARIYQSTKGPYRDARGHVLGLIGVSRDVTEHLRAKEQEAKLRIAREIQRRFFPSAPPRLAGFDVAGASYPADDTGGDYFDYFPLPDGSLAVAVGDASGHGFGPALRMSEVRAYLRALALTRTDLGEILGLLNRALAEENEEKHFVTLLLARLEPAARALSYASAGHPTGYVLGPDGAVKAALQSGAPPLGVDLAADFPCGEAVRLAGGDLALLLTDGILEARSAVEEPFGRERTLAFVRAHQGEGPGALVAGLYGAVRAFEGNAPQVDDITAVVIKAQGAP
jgi:sigma-B regulation protein RsbU (phosphoserine phosphatase)